MRDRLVTGGDIVTPRGPRRTDVAISDDTIAAVGTDLDPQGAEVIDADGMIVLPGVIDVHNHMHDDDLFPEGIDFGSETASAVAGGVTTVVELPTQTPVTSPEAFAEKRRACEDLAHVDFGLVAGNVQDSDLDIEGLLA
jgi:dihydropyrimidinase/dihydroorotase